MPLTMEDIAVNGTLIPEVPGKPDRIGADH